MTELLAEIVNKRTLVVMVIAVATTEAIMRISPENITRWKYAILTAVVTSLVFSILISFTQKGVSLADGAIRGGISAILAIAFYDVLKSIVINLPFVNSKSKGGKD